MRKIIAILFDKKQAKMFEKEFDTEFERDNFIRKLKYSKDIMFVRNGEYR